MRRSCSPPPAYPPPSPDGPDHLYSELVRYYTFFRFIFWGYPESTLGHMSKKKAPNYCVLPDSGGHCGPKGKPATFFPVLFFFLKRGQL